MKKCLLLAMCIAAASAAFAQLSSNPDKFLGNITTSYQVDYGNEKYYTLWNQITPENESKWGSVEGRNNSFNWGCDTPFNYAKQHKFTYKFHALVWGSQYPSWLESQTPEQRYREIVQWMDEAKKKYPSLPLIDVVNEAIDGHQAGTPYFIEALGGRGKTGYDWLIKAFELAYERWPDAILIYNDFNTFQWNTDQFIDLVRTLRDAGAPIDAYGCQSHDLTDCSFDKFKSSMVKIQSALQMPMYSTEYDIGTDDDNLQLQRYKEQIPYMWEADYVAGVTLWGYIYGKTWTTNGNSGIIKNGKDRPAMTWLREYMKTDAAKNAKSPFPGMVKEASLYIKPQSLNLEQGVESAVNITARLRTKQIEKVEFYVDNVLDTTFTEAPYTVNYVPTKIGKRTFKAVVYDTEGNTYQRISQVNVATPRAPYKGTPASIPGTLQAENFDTGAEGIAFHDTNSNKEGDGATYRSDTGGIDVVKGGTGYAIGYTQEGEWMEYTVDVKKAGYYDFVISYSAPDEGASISLALSNEKGLSYLTPTKFEVPKTSSWSTFKTAQGRLQMPLEEGKQVIRLAIAGGSATYIINIDYIRFTHVEVNDDIKISLAADPATATVAEEDTLTAVVESDTEISKVSFYVNNALYKNVTSAPYQVAYKPSAAGIYNIKAVATDAEGKVSKVAQMTLTVNKKRTPFKGVIELPGIVEAENFDKCGEGVSFHDSDAKDEGDATSYRTDNEGVDIVKGNGGYAIGYTAANEWLEYSINVKEPGKYSYEATVSSGADNSGFYLALADNGTVTRISSNITVPNGGNWDTYRTMKGNITRELTEGEHILRITIVGANCNIDKIKFNCTLNTGVEEVVELKPLPYNVFTPSGAFVGVINATGSADVRRKVRALAGEGIFIVKGIKNGISMKIATR